MMDTQLVFAAFESLNVKEIRENGKLFAEQQVKEVKRRLYDEIQAAAKILEQLAPLNVGQMIYGGTKGDYEYLRWDVIDNIAIGDKNLTVTLFIDREDGLNPDKTSLAIYSNKNVYSISAKA